MGWVEEDNYKTAAMSAIKYNNNLVALNPLDVNIAKQLNILLTQLGLSPERIVMDPSTSALGYGIEYCYSAMERLKIAALIQNDKMTQMPIITDVGPEVWKVKEVRESEDNYPEWGDQEKRAINWEAITCGSMLLSGSNILIMRHPGAISLIKEFIQELM
jgi:acetyl-CoA decarbonylase/synthase, CODH/ACS complex subunit delta